MFTWDLTSWRAIESILRRNQANPRNYIWSTTLGTVQESLGTVQESFVVANANQKTYNQSQIKLAITDYSKNVMLKTLKQYHFMIWRSQNET